MANLPLTPDQHHSLFGSVSQPIPAGPELVVQLHAAARTANKEDFSSALASAALQCKTGQFGLLLLAIDPATGNSLLHSAAAGDNMDAMRAIPTVFRGRNTDPVFNMFMAHKNAAGDTALHVVAKYDPEDWRSNPVTRDEMVRLVAARTTVEAALRHQENVKARHGRQAEARRQQDRNRPVALARAQAQAQARIKAERKARHRS